MQRLKLFGGLSIDTGTGPLTGRAVQRRRLALLALLAAARARGVGRDRAIAYLWPDADAETGRSFLSDSVYRVNQALGGDVIVTAADELRLDSQRLPSDLGEFEDAVARNDFEGAVALYAGPLLDGFFLPDAPEFERWAEIERDRVAREYGRVLETLAIAAEGRSDTAAAAEWWRRLAAHDPFNSRIALRLMQALVAVGERAAAIVHARVHEALLRQELDLEPDAAVLALAERLKSEGGRPVSKGVLAATRSASAVLPPDDVPVDTPQRSPPPIGLPPVAGARAGKPVRQYGIRIAVAAILLGFAMLAGAVLWRGRSAGAARASSIRTVAVLPFVNLGADPGNEYASDGMTEELINTLAGVDGVRVVSRTSAFAYKGRPVDVRDVARRLGVEAVVEGSVRRSGRTLRVTARLVSATSGYDLWSESYSRELDDVFAIQEEIARAIVAKLTGALLAGGGRPLERQIQDPEAYDLYLKGRYAWHQRSREGLRTAIDYFIQATARSPRYARAYVGLADAYAVSAFYDYIAPLVAYPRADSAARRALELDPGLAEPHATLGYILTYYDLDWPRAEQEFRRAIALEPNYSTAHQWYANLLTVSGRFDEAEREMRSAQETDPLSLIASAALGWTRYFAGRNEAALAQCRQALELDPDFALAHLWGGWALEAMGRRVEARAWIGRAVRLSHETTLSRLALAHLLAGSASIAEQDSARAILREFEARSARGEYVPSYEVAKVHLALGNRGPAVTLLDRAARERSHSMAFLRVDPQLARLRGDPVFEALVASVFAARRP